MSETNNKHAFQTEVKELLNLVTHSLYSNKEIFLRELISNSSDALDRLRFEALSDDSLYEGNSELEIYVEFNPKERTVTIRDNGIGMLKEEVMRNLGTIAKSGTKEFLSSLSGDKAKDANLIGQFGVGFYSAFVVADKVEVKTRRAGTSKAQGVLWESQGDGEYSVDNIELDEHGTSVTLHLKAEENEFLDHFRLKNIITKYSDHILFPIKMLKPAEKEEEKKEIEWETVNNATALWTLNKSEISTEEYQEFYKHVAHDFEDPLTWTHNHVEGKLDYTTLLYIPKHAPFDLWQREHRFGLKLYVKRVFVMDDAEQLLPNYLRFMRGIVDSKDLPLNVSREILQSNKIIDNIKSGITKRVLDMLDKLASKDTTRYKEFWRSFGQVIKEGTAEDPTNKERIAKLLRFASTHNEDDEQNVSLDDYISRMKDGQDKIYFVTADSPLAARNSPHLEIFRKKGIEVLLLSERIDEWLTVHFTEYQGKKLQSIAKGELDLGGLKDEEAEENKEKVEQTKEDLKDIISKMQDVLKDKVKEIRVTDRLTDSPTCLVTEEQDMGLHLQRIMIAAGQNMPAGKPIMEINPDHAIIQKLKSETDVTRISDWSEILFEQALLAEGAKLENPGAFVKKMNKLLIEAEK